MTPNAGLRSIPPGYILPDVAGHNLKPYWNRCRPFTTFVVCFATTLIPALAQTVPWSPFNSKPFQFAVSFCGEPTADPPVTETKGVITGTTRLFKALGENYFCMVGISDYNIKPSVEKELLLNQTNFIEAIKGTLGDKPPARVRECARETSGADVHIRD